MRSWRSVVTGVFLIVIGCSATNTQNWAITNPTLDQRFEYVPITGVTIPITVSCNTGNAPNNVGVFSVNNFQLSSEIKSITSAATSPFNWSGSLAVMSMPPDYTVTTVIDAKVYTGMPQSEMTGVNAKQHTAQNIKLHQGRTAM